MERKFLWGGYGQYEGWRFGGDVPFVLPENATWQEKVLAVTMRAEGSMTYNALNMYDSGGVSLGPIQVIEFGQYGVSDMLGYCVARGAFGPGYSSAFDEAMYASQAAFRKTLKGVSRFFLPDPYGEVNSLVEQQILFFGEPGVGKKGTWGPVGSTMRAHALAWAKGLVDIFSQPNTKKAVSEFCALRLLSWYDDAFFTDKSPDGWWGVAHAAFLMFCVNYPKTARAKLKEWREWINDGDVGEGEVLRFLQLLTFSGVNTWPFRYNQARPELERLYGVDLPDFTQDLSRYGTDAYITTKELQARLIHLNYDLGPAGADGVYGQCTQKAVWTFQQLNGVRPTGVPDAQTVLALKEKTEDFIPVSVEAP